MSIKRIGFVLFPGFQLLDATGPIAVFEVGGRIVEYLCDRGLRAESGGYQIELLSVFGGLVESSVGVALPTKAFSKSDQFDTLVVVGGDGIHQTDFDSRVPVYVQQMDAQVRRTASVCSGAFVLATAGLLDGRQATTHWRRSRLFAEQFPKVKCVPDKIFVNDGKYWSSAGISAGIDLALAMLKQDYGEEVAQQAAREMVIYYQRPGGQSQFSTVAEVAGSGHRFSGLLGWIRENLDQPLSVVGLAEQVAMSPRNFARQFRRVVGLTPAKAIEQIRLEVAQRLVEDSDLALGRVAQRVGYGDAERMRRAFQRTLGMSPQALRTSTRQGK
ncbi:GlxA family transcriptional regulator [Aurantivibrio plasticivorans]